MAIREAGPSVPQWTRAIALGAVGVLYVACYIRLMLFAETLRVALASLRANKLRSLLTMLGVVIGIASVIAMIALGTGAKHAVQERIAKLGTTLLQIDENFIRVVGVQQAV